VTDGGTDVRTTDTATATPTQHVYTPAKLSKANHITSCTAGEM